MTNETLDSIAGAVVALAAVALCEGAARVLGLPVWPFYAVALWRVAKVWSESVRARAELAAIRASLYAAVDEAAAGNLAAARDLAVDAEVLRDA